MQRRIVSRAIIGCVLTSLANRLYCEDLRQYTYLESTGAVESSHTWIVRYSEGDIETRWIAPDKAYSNLCDGTGNTQQWRVQSAEGNITAQRAGNLIRLEGSRNGKAIQQEAEIDDAPWFQPLSYALGRFSQSQLESVVFWNTRPDNLEVVKLRARKLGEEQLTTPAGLFLARKISISLNGFLSHLWQAHYWFRHADGLFVRYEGANGLPGTPTTTIQLGS